MLKYLILTIAILLSVAGCYPSISGTVIDSETGQPIEGAVVLVEWTKTHGFGEHWTESYKVVEVLTDREGRFTIPGVFNLLIDPPRLTIYRKAYVAWNSHEIFPDYQKRTEFKWKNSIYKLELFKKSYSYIDHTSFLGNSIRSSIGNKRIIKNAFEWEELEASKERDKRDKLLNK